MVDKANGCLCDKWRVLVLSVFVALCILVLSRLPTTTTHLPPQDPSNSTTEEVKFDYTKDVDLPKSSEYVLVYKLPPPLDPDDYKPNRFNAYNTGVFRPPYSNLWDPHPQYIFHAFNKRFHIVLNQIPKTHSFLIPGFRVTTHTSSHDSTFSNRTSDASLENCFYNGYVLGDMDSSVAVSLCSGMTGHIRTSTGSYFIEPRSNNEHEIYKIPPVHSTTTKRKNLNINAYDYYTDEDYDSHERKKRSLSTERYVELTVVTDQTMSRYHGENLKHYVLTLLSIVALVYRDASIGNPVNIILVNFHVLTDTDFSPTNTTTHGTSASEMLRNFCKWQKEHNYPDDRHALHHDTALLLTRNTICRNPWVGKCDTLGLAELGTMCDLYASCAIVQDNGLSAAFTIAHELGHVLNMPHDDDYKCQGFVTSNSGEFKHMSQAYVMSRMLDHNTYPWAWSSCSRHFLTEFLDAGHGYCLEDKPNSNLLHDEDNYIEHDQQPGEIFSEHKQCQLVFGKSSQLCSYMPPCRRLWCTNGGGPESEESEGCRTQHMPWADGTRCGANKWCQRGACVLKDLEKLRIINGGWGTWQEYGECSRVCGGGVRKSYRECDNPKPKNGGKYCVGPRVRYESCNTFECANNTADFRANQCSHFNGDNFNIHGLPSDVAWVPKYNGISPKDMCKLFCRVQGSSSYYLLKEKVIDGTPCGIDTFDVCVNGACLPAGCDRRLHSTKTLDICGMCGGDGSTCTRSQGSYNTTKYGYNSVIIIPSGASNIDIRQRSYDNTARDDNYLSLFDPTTNEYVLNGHFVVSMFRKTVQYGGTTLEYTGSDQVVERINSSSRALKKNLEVRVLSVGKLKYPDITYQYVSSNKSDNTFNWVVTAQTCSDVCQGTYNQTVECVVEHSNQIVDPAFCSRLRAPTNAVPCNTNCRLFYKTSCPDNCVLAYNHTVECVKQVNNSTATVATSLCVKSNVPIPDPPDCVRNCRNKKPKWRYTQWSDCNVYNRCTGNNTGVQIRNVWCQKFNWKSLINNTLDHFEVVDDRFCESEKPEASRNCKFSNSQVCGHWVIQQWSPCSTTCGPGRTRALYACVLKASNQILPLDYCTHAQRPATEIKCEITPCGVYEFSEWSDCDCTTLQKSRTAVCYVHNTVTNNSVCEAFNSTPPVLTAACVCNPYTLSNWSEDCRLYNGNYYKHRVVTCDYDNCSQQPVTKLECGAWKVTSEWGECNGSCNVGVEARNVSCVLHNQIVEEARCDGTNKPVATRNCYHECNIKSLRAGKREDGVGGNIHQYYFISHIWVTGEWSQCSMEGDCGTPRLQHRVVECVYNNSKRVVQESYCNKNNMPVSTRVCNTTERCGEWSISDWSTCNATNDCKSNISHGYKTRNISCTSNKLVIDDKYCNGRRAEDQEKCVVKCNARWKIGKWGACVFENKKKQCGKGKKTRYIDCLFNNNTVNESICKKHSRGKKLPKTHKDCYKICNSSQKTNFKWVTTPWSNCSRACGGYGLSSRRVSCHRVSHDWVDPDGIPQSSANGSHYCAHPKPKEYDYCMVSETCTDVIKKASYEWKTSDYSDCVCPNATSTANSYKKRKVYCTNNGVKVQAKYCELLQKPQRKLKCVCNVHESCEQTRNRLISTHSQVKDGEYKLFVGGKLATVYCHGMTDLTQVPKEYVTLANFDNNFSEIYDKRLIRPDTCPRNGSRMNSCECVLDKNRRVGVTNWSKLRINVTNLRVDEHDFTYAISRGDNIAYGTGGDCYSSLMNCPQGGFQIDLRLTSFGISPVSNWVSTGHRVSMRISRKSTSNVSQLIQGKCGGYCGTCVLSKTIGLRVEVI